MSQENVEIVRQPISLHARPRRRAVERLALRFPRALALGARAIWSLPPSSRLRRAAMRRAVVSGWEALNRGDVEVLFGLYHSNVESEFRRAWLGTNA